MRVILAALASALIIPTASAQVVVVGSGLAKECYDAVESNRIMQRIAIDTCDKALSHEIMNRKNRAATYINRGILYMRSGEYERSIRDYDAGLEIRPDNAEAHLNKGAALIYLNKYEAAIAELNLAIDKDSSKLHAAYYNRALALERTGDVTGAYYDFKEAIRLEPTFELAQSQLERFSVQSKTQ